MRSFSMPLCRTGLLCIRNLGNLLLIIIDPMPAVMFLHFENVI